MSSIEHVHLLLSRMSLYDIDGSHIQRPPRHMYATPCMAGPQGQLRGRRKRCMCPGYYATRIAIGIGDFGILTEWSHWPILQSTRHFEGTTYNTCAASVTKSLCHGLKTISLSDAVFIYAPVWILHDSLYTKALVLLVTTLAVKKSTSTSDDNTKRHLDEREQSIEYKRRDTSITHVDMQENSKLTGQMHTDLDASRSARKQVITSRTRL
ncbi:hypothetical protein EDB19DRAFT_1830879 [Suillus lakei]|nr:hypothetical protein EDB19DRAFT_1830879 [Suillus lakei]